MRLMYRLLGPYDMMAEIAATKVELFCDAGGGDKQEIMLGPRPADRLNFDL